MNIFLSVKYFEDLRNRALIEQICAALEEQGHSTFCIIRDVEEWGRLHFSNHELMERTFAAIERSDLLIAEFSHKGVGLGIEAGYARARGIPILALGPQDAELSPTLEGTAGSVFRYQNPRQLIQFLQSDLKKDLS